MESLEADALVTAGERWLTCGGETRHLRPGDTFFIAQATPHSEKHGPEGATHSSHAGPAESRPGRRPSVNSLVARRSSPPFR